MSGRVCDTCGRSVEAVGSAHVARDADRAGLLGAWVHVRSDRFACPDRFGGAMATVSGTLERK